MKIPVIAIVLLFIIILTYAIKRSDRTITQQKKDFWDRENESNSVRKKSLDNLPYIIIPTEFYNIQIDTTDQNGVEGLRMLNFLRDQKIVNFTGISNTDLKLEYGTANINALTEYDQNYTTLVRALQKLADSLLASGQDNLAKQVLEFAVETKTDVSATYKALAKIYQKESTPEKIDHLIEIASSLNSAMSPSICRTLKELSTNPDHTEE